jgi:hypothetical protein
MFEGRAHPRHAGKRRFGLTLLALVLLPLLLFLHAPLLAALVPGALLTAASFDAIEAREHPALARARVVTPDDHDDLRRLASATPIEATSNRRVA